MSYDGGCGDADCELCKADAEAARDKFMLMMGAMTVPERQKFARRFNEYEHRVTKEPKE